MAQRHLSFIPRAALRARRSLTAIALGGLVLGTFAPVPAQAAPEPSAVQPIIPRGGIGGGGTAAPLPTFVNLNAPDWSSYNDSKYNALPPGAFLDS